ncbi:MAG: DUF4199 domain-containing protein [Bacteroidota bacterium]
MTVTKNAMNFGALLEVAMCVVNAIVMLLGFDDTKGIDQYIGYALVVVVTYWGTKSFRDKHNDGFISYGSAFSSCLQIAFFSSIILAFFMFMYLKFVDDSLIQKILEKSEEQMLNQNMPDDQIEMAMEMTRKFTTPIFIAFTVIVAQVIMGLIFGLITAIFLKRDNPDFNNFIKQQSQ